MCNSDIKNNVCFAALKPKPKPSKMNEIKKK